MFNESRADLSGMVNTREGIFINHVVQKAYIQVDEDGSEAAPRRREIMIFFLVYLNGIFPSFVILN